MLIYRSVTDMGIIEEHVTQLFATLLVFISYRFFLCLLVYGWPLLWTELQSRGNKDTTVRD